jgi:hypothetical protein
VAIITIGFSEMVAAVAAGCCGAFHLVTNHFSGLSLSALPVDFMFVSDSCPASFAA